MCTKNILPVAAIFAILYSSIGFAKGRDFHTPPQDTQKNYQVRGPKAQSAFERKLRQLNTSYILGIFPRKQVRSKGINADALEQQSYIGDIKNWLDRFLADPLGRGNVNTQNGVALSFPTRPQSIIAGQLAPKKFSKVSRVTFQAKRNTLGLTFIFQKSLQRPTKDTQATDLKEMLRSLTNFPTMYSLKIKTNLKSMANQTVVYGQFIGKTPPETPWKHKRGWQKIDFWYTKQKLFLKFYTGKQPKKLRAQPRGPWEFSRQKTEGMGEDRAPPQRKEAEEERKGAGEFHGFGGSSADSSKNKNSKDSDWGF